LTERLGDAGRKIHTGRSRNDQILVATRLWLKEKLGRVARLSREVARVALDRAAAEKDLPIPGYTHIQRAVVSSAGMWWAGWAEAFIDDAIRATDTLELVDCNPLGTAAGYGVNLKLDREHTTSALGFARMQVSPVYAQLSRGKFELAALEALGSATLDLRRLAWDLSLYTTAEFGFVALPPQYTTGSSIMPNKRNPDVIELMRATHASVAAARTEIEQLLSLPSGYQRDLQSSKGAIVHGFARGLAALELLPALLANLEWREDKLRAAIDSGMYATDVAVEAAIAGVPFREAYKAAAASADTAGQGRTRVRAGLIRPAGRRRSPASAAVTRAGACPRQCTSGSPTGWTHHEALPRHRHAPTGLRPGRGRAAPGIPGRPARARPAGQRGWFRRWHRRRLRAAGHRQPGRGAGHRRCRSAGTDRQFRPDRTRVEARQPRRPLSA